MFIKKITLYTMSFQLSHFILILVLEKFDKWVNLYLDSIFTYDLIKFVFICIFNITYQFVYTIY